NADLPAGGSKAAAERMAEEFVRSGGTLRVGRRVLRLEHDGATARSVVLSDGTTDEADHFIIATDPFSSYRALTGRPLPRALRKMSEDRRLFTFSSVHCAFSCPADPPFRGELMLPLPDAARGVYGAGSIALREFSHEKNCAPDGETVIQAFVFCDKKATDAYLYKYRDKKAYAAEKERFAALAEETITTRFPALCGRLGLLDVWTPATYERYTGSGSYMSFAFGAGYIPHRAGCRADGFDNVFLATQWLTPPGGLPNAACAGKAAAEKINALCIKRSVRHVSAQGKADTV
ncbi:MAG: FAD-dependent oxidoreductase, partial [Clostridia bacterium]|nr:FAD-dependent oxidoreductase [Clostridia bacterium]